MVHIIFFQNSLTNLKLKYFEKVEVLTLSFLTFAFTGKVCCWPCRSMILEEKVHIMPTFKKNKKQYLNSLTSVLGKIMEQILLETMPKHLKPRRDRQYRFPMANHASP